ncbi:hypothetical protein FA15DRAFT_667932 [Coprinopsis marcescibilis]|uniref:Vacuolar membrane protein n=1 Tax=Coprinopsis marcescibilis TaxID=230819 RepID=A0A5C3L0I0_COPMA|nr:hypothetical protein FA15DRAFT_667932 [Coprinopsis marcescibilis]
MDFFAVVRSEEGLLATAVDTKAPLDPGPSCELLGPTALIVQGLMGILVIGSLVFKRYREKPRRPWRIWLFDVSKQVVGQMFVHGVNVLISGVISELTDRNACVFYFLNILIDTTLGVLIIYGALHALIFLFSEKLGYKGFESGVYGNPPLISYWLRQTATYLICLLAMKIVVIGIFMFIPGVFSVGAWLLSWTQTGNGDVLEVIFVMGIFPIAMNILQFWLIDSIVKGTTSEPALALDTANPLDDPDREPLFNASDDEDDTSLRRPRDLENQISPHPSQTTFGSEQRSHDTGITTPDNEETKYFKDSETGGRQGDDSDKHSYPPSLSNSLGSSSSGSGKSAKEAKSLLQQKTRTKTASPSPQRVESHVQLEPVSLKPIVHTNNHAPQKSDDWAVTWDQEDDWAEQPPPTEVKAQEHDRNTTVDLQRPRRLS